MSKKFNYGHAERSERELLEERAVLFQEMQLLATTAEKENREMTVAERRAWLKGAERFEEITYEMAEMQSELERMGAADEVFRSARSNGKTPEPSTVIGNMFRALYANGNTTGRGPMANDWNRSFNLTTGSAVIQDPQVQREFFESLKANNPLSMLGAQFITGPNFQQFPVQTADPTVVWFEEGDAAITPDATAAINSVKVEYKTAAMLILASNFWLEDSSRLGAEVLSQMAVSKIQESVIKAVLNGVAASGQPTGLDSIVGVQTVDAGGALASYAKIVEGVKKLLAVNVPLEKIGGIYSPGVWEQINNLADQNDNPLIVPPGLRDIPMYTSSAVLEDYGTGDDESRIYLGDWSQILIASSAGPRVTLLREHYATSFQTAFLCHMRFDMQVPRPNNFVRVEGITIS